MAPKVAKKAEEAQAAPAGEKRKAEESTAEEPEAKKVVEKFQEPDAPKDNRPAVKEQIVFDTAETTLNVVQTLGGKLLKSMTEGGMSYFLAGARANVGSKAGRYMFEAKMVELLEQGGGNKQGKAYLKVGFSTSSSSLLMEEESVGFDCEGNFCAEKKRTQMKGNGKFGAQVVAVVLNLDSKSPNANTIALYRDGVAVGDPMPLPDALKEKALFPHVSFRNCTVTTNFGPTPMKALPFTCRMLSGAASSDCTVTPSKQPKGGTYEMVMPVGFPDEGTFDWLDTFLEKNPQYVELSDRKLVQWARASGLWNNAKVDSNDQMNLNFQLPGQDAPSLRKAVMSIAPLVPRNYLVMKVKDNLMSSERKQILKRFNYPHYKKIAHVVMGEPGKEYKATIQQKLLKEKQTKSDNAFNNKKKELDRKKASEKKKKEVAKQRKEMEKKKKQAIYEKKVKEAEAKGEDPPEPEPVEEEVEEKEEEEVAEAEPPTVELTDEEKAINFLPKSTPDLTPIVMNQSFGKFTTPEEDEGFDDVKFEWFKGQKATDYLKKWVLEKKLTTRVDDIKPGATFKEKSQEFDKLLKDWQEKLKAFKASKKKSADEAQDIDLFTVTDINDVGNGSPLYENFTFEDWMLVKTRFHFALLIWSFKKDTGDDDRTGIPLEHLGFYFQKYYGAGLNAKNYGVADTKDVLAFVKDTVSVKDKLLVTNLNDDFDSMANFDIFVKLTEEQRQERCRRIEAGDETARLKFVAPAETKQAPKAAAKAEATGKLGATPAPKASAGKGGKK